MAVTASFIETPAQVLLQGNDIRFVVATSLDLGTVSNVYIHLAIQYWNGSVWADVQEYALPQVDAAAEFDIHEYFTDQVAPAFTFPEHYTNLIVPQAGMVQKFRVRAWETYDGKTTDADALQYATDLYVIPGGLSEDDVASLNEANSDWWTQWQSEQRFQNWMPGTKETAPDAVEKLYWIARQTATEILQIAWTDTNGATGTFSTTFAMTQFAMYELSVSPALVKQLIGADVASYSVVISGQSETVNYTVNRNYYEQNEYFLFSNDYGCYESLWCRGYRSGEIGYNRTQYEKAKTSEQRVTDILKGNTRAKITSTRKSVQGYTDEEWYIWSLSLLSSDQVFKYATSQIWPVVVNTAKQTYPDDLNDVPFSLVFEWNYSREGRFASRLGLSVEYLLPPYFSKVAAFFWRRKNNTLVDLVNGEVASSDGTDITWPTIAASDVFDFSNATYWDQTLIPKIANGGWYDTAKPRTCPLSWMEGATWAEAATDSAHARLFHHDYTSRLRDIIPAIVYASDLSAAEQAVIVKWLDWYFTIFENGSLLTENNIPITQ